jgi:hypothetical protein
VGAPAATTAAAEAVFEAPGPSGLSDPSHAALPVHAAELAARADSFCETLRRGSGPARAVRWLEARARQPHGAVARGLRADGLGPTLERAARLLELAALVPRRREASLVELAHARWGAAPDAATQALFDEYVRWLAPWAGGDRDAWLAVGVRKGHVAAHVEATGFLPLRRAGEPGDGRPARRSRRLGVRALRESALERVPPLAVFAETRSAYHAVASLLPPDGLAALTGGYPNQAARLLAWRLAASGCRVAFWGNPDVAGFAALRAFGPGVQPLLMAPETVRAHRGDLAPLRNRSLFEARLAASGDALEWETLQASLLLSGRLAQDAIPCAEVAAALSELASPALVA